MSSVWVALADETRRRIVDELARSDRSAGDLAGMFAISRPGVSRHLRVLREAGLVSVTPAAQRRVYSLVPQRLDALSDWVGELRSSWEQRLDALETEVSRGRRVARRPTRTDSDSTREEHAS
jgi:DNA-binding transcriptional ArsR family regulator